MIDDPQTPGTGPEGTGQESSLGGTASEWSTVTPAQPPSAPTEPPPPPPQALEPLPPPPPAAPIPPAAPPAPPASSTGSGGYQQVYGSGPTTTPPPPPSGYSSAPGAYTPPPPPPPGYGGGPQYPPPAVAGQGLSSNAAAAISYITFIPAVVFLVVEPYSRDRFVRFHSWQSISLWIVLVGLRIIFYVLAAMSFHLLWWLFLLVRMAIGFVLFVFWLIALIKASQGQWFKIPVVGDIAASIAGG